MVRILKAHFKVPYPLLVCTYTNAAVDNLVEGIVATGLKPLRVGSEASVREDLAHRSLHVSRKRDITSLALIVIHTRAAPNAKSPRLGQIGCLETGDRQQASTIRKFNKWLIPY